MSEWLDALEKRADSRGAAPVPKLEVAGGGAGGDAPLSSRSAGRVVAMQSARHHTPRSPAAMA